MLSDGFLKVNQLFLLTAQKTPYRSPMADADLPKIPAAPIGYGDAQKLFQYSVIEFCFTVALLVTFQAHGQ